MSRLSGNDPARYVHGVFSRIGTFRVPFLGFVCTGSALSGLREAHDFNPSGQGMQ